MSTIEIPFEANPTRSAVWLRHFGFGPTGSGKSKGALRLAFALSPLFDGAPVTLINTEVGRGKLYADRFPIAGYIGLDELGDFSPETCARAIEVAERRNPGGIIVFDSASHEWMGNNGVLQQADRFGDWKTVRPKHNAFVQRLIACECHVIVTCRANMKYEVSEEQVPGRDRPRQVVQALGVGPVQSSDLQYEFNLVGQYELSTHEVRYSGHVDPLIDTVHDLDDDADLADVAEKLAQWLSEGDPILPPPTADEGEVTRLRAALDAGGATAEAIEEFFDKGRRRNRGQLHPEWVATQIEKAEAALASRGSGAASEPEPATA